MNTRNEPPCFNSDQARLLVKANSLQSSLDWNPSQTIGSTGRDYEINRLKEFREQKYELLESTVALDSDDIQALANCRKLEVSLGNEYHTARAKTHQNLIKNAAKHQKEAEETYENSLEEASLKGFSKKKAEEHANEAKSNCWTGIYRKADGDIVQEYNTIESKFDEEFRLAKPKIMTGDLPIKSHENNEPHKENGR